MIINNKKFSQTHTLAKFCATRASLYDTNELKILVIDQVLDWANEITTHIAPSIRAAMREKNYTKSIKLRKDFIENDLIVWFSYLEDLLKNSSLNKKFFTDKFSVADITAWRVIFWFCSGKLDLINPSFLNETPTLKKYYDEIGNYKPLSNLEEFKLITN